MNNNNYLVSTISDRLKIYNIQNNKTMNRNELSKMRCKIEK